MKAAAALRDGWLAKGSSPWANRNPLLAGLLLVFAYSAFAWIGLNFARVEGAGSPIWPAAGIGLAGLILGGTRLWPAIAAGRLLAAFLSGSSQPLWADCAIALGNGVATLVPIMILIRFGFDCRLASVRSMLSFLTFGVVLSGLMAAIFGTATLIYSSGLSFEQATSTYVLWASGSITGGLIIGPLVLAWWYGGPLKRPLVFLLLFAFLIGLCLLHLYIGESEFFRTWHFIPLLIAAAVSYQVRGASLAIYLVAFTEIYAISVGQISFTSPTMNPADAAVLLQHLIAILAIPVLLLGALDLERALSSELQIEMTQSATKSGTFLHQFAANSADLDRRASRLLNIQQFGTSLSLSKIARSIHPDDQSSFLKFFKNALEHQSEERISIELRLQPDESGASQWIAIHGQTDTIVQGGFNVPHGIRGTIQNITDRKHAEVKAATSAEFLRHVLDNLLVFVAVLDRDGNLISANKRALENAGLNPKEEIGRPFWECYWWNHSSDLQQWLQTACQKAASGHIVRKDIQARAKNGVLIWIDFQISPLTDENGKITHLIPCGMDITRRKETTSENQRLARVIELSPDFVGVADEEFRSLFINPAGIKMLGVEKFDDIAGKFIRDFHTPDGFARIKEGIKTSLRDHEVWRGETDLVSKDGNVIPVFQTIVRHTDHDGQINHSTTIRDISMQKQAEEHQKLLMRELDHRTKNLMSITQSITRQTARAESDPSILAEKLCGRIDALALAHNKLSSGSWGFANMRELLLEQIQIVANADKHAFTLEGPDIQLPPEGANKFSQCIHEMTVNAIKHGAFKDQKGKLQVTWHSENDRIYLRWEETCSSGPADIRVGKGFGTRLVQASYPDYKAASTDTGLVITFSIDPSWGRGLLSG